MIYDSMGNPSIIEWNNKEGNIYFTDGCTSKPDIMTNHPMYVYSKYAIEDLPREMCMKVKFYPNNGPVDPRKKENTSIFSPYINFTLERTLQSARPVM